MIENYKYYFKEGRRHKLLFYATMDGHITHNEFFEETDNTINLKSDTFPEFLTKSLLFYLGQSLETKLSDRIGFFCGHFDKYNYRKITQKGIVDDLTLNPIIIYQRIQKYDFEK